MRPRARGRATRIRKRACHITIVVSRMPEAELERRRAAEASRPGSRAARRAGQVAADDRRRRVRKSRAEAAHDHDHDHDHDHEGHDHEHDEVVSEDDVIVEGIVANEPEVDEIEATEPETAEVEEEAPVAEAAEEDAADDAEEGEK
jgi:large subunit ribosomal protein L22